MGVVGQSADVGAYLVKVKNDGSAEIAGISKMRQVAEDSMVGDWI